MDWFPIQFTGTAFREYTAFFLKSSNRPYTSSGFVASEGMWCTYMEIPGNDDRAIIYINNWLFIFFLSSFLFLKLLLVHVYLNFYWCMYITASCLHFRVSEFWCGEWEMHALFPKMLTLFSEMHISDTEMLTLSPEMHFWYFGFLRNLLVHIIFRVLLSVFGFGLPSWGFYVMPETIGSHVQNVVRGMALSLEPEPRKEGSSKKKKSKCNRNDWIHL